MWSALAAREGSKRMPGPQADLFTGSDSANPHWMMHHAKPSKVRYWSCNHSVNSCLFYLVYFWDLSAKAEKLWHHNFKHLSQDWCIVASLDHNHEGFSSAVTQNGTKRNKLLFILKYFVQVFTRFTIRSSKLCRTSASPIPIDLFYCSTIMANWMQV